MAKRPPNARARYSFAGTPQKAGYQQLQWRADQPTIAGPWPQTAPAAPPSRARPARLAVFAATAHAQNVHKSCHAPWPWSPTASATTAIGTADVRSTFLHLSRPAFATSEAQGFLEYKINSVNISSNAWLRFTITKTNGQVVVVGLTNQTQGINATNIAAQIVSMINTNPVLQGSDGLSADDFSFNPSFSTFSLRARSPSFKAARINIYAQRSGSSLKLVITPGGNGQLTQNISSICQGGGRRCISKCRVDGNNALNFHDRTLRLS